MANIQSPLLSNPTTLVSAGEENNVVNEYGRVRTFNTSVELTQAQLEDTASVVMLGPVPTGATVLRIWLATDDLDAATGLTWDVGIYENADDAVETKDEDVYATGITAGQAVTPFTDVAFEARDIEATGQKVWEDAGDTQDDNETYYIGAKVATAATTGQDGTLAAIVEFSAD